jgi:purine-cytosine permease-like protein
MLSATLMEHFYFRKGNFALYDIQFWNVPSRLPLGAAALGSCILSFGLVIPSMNQVLYTGDIARRLVISGSKLQWWSRLCFMSHYATLKSVGEVFEQIWILKGYGVGFGGSQMNELNE